MIDVRRLGLLLELTRRGTITAVADALAYTPSAVSHQLAALEREAGVPLLERTGRTVALSCLRAWHQGTRLEALIAGHPRKPALGARQNAPIRPVMPTPAFRCFGY